MIDNGSHGSGNVSWLGGSTSIQNIWDLDAERSLSAHDVAHRVAVAGLWQLPFGRDRKWGSDWNRVVDLVLGGWSVSGVFSRQSGMPLSVTQSGGQIWDGTQRPNLIGDPSTSGPIQEPAQQLLQRRRLLAAGAGRPRHRAPDPQLPRAGHPDLRRRADEERRDSTGTAARGANRGPERPQPSGVRRSQYELRIDVLRSDHRHEGRAAPDDGRTQVPLLIPRLVRVRGGRRLWSFDHMRRPLEGLGRAQRRDTDECPASACSINSVICAI